MNTIFLRTAQGQIHWPVDILMNIIKLKNRHQVAIFETEFIKPVQTPFLIALLGTLNHT